MTDQAQLAVSARLVANIIDERWDTVEPAPNFWFKGHWILTDSGWFPDGHSSVECPYECGWWARYTKGHNRASIWALQCAWIHICTVHSDEAAPGEDYDDKVKILGAKVGGRLFDMAKSKTFGTNVNVVGNFNDLKVSG